MEALLLYRAGSDYHSLIEGFKYEGITLREVQWSPMLNFEELGWGTRLIFVYLDKDKKLLASTKMLKAISPHVRIILFEEREISAAANTAMMEKIVERSIILPCQFFQAARIIKSVVFNEENLTQESMTACENLVLDANRRCISYNSTTIPLRNKEYELLEYLIINRGKLITRTSLIENIWDRNAKISSNTLDVHIGRLRKKLELPLRAKYIHTVHSIGYRFDCNG